MLKELNRPEVLAFITANADSDIHQLLFKKDKYPNIPMQLAVDQIRSRKKARTKVPEWYATEGVIFPPPLSMEQCSSEATARFKAGLVSGEQGLDLTGGAGIDSYYLAQVFQSFIYVEQQSVLCALAEHNFDKLASKKPTVIEDSAEHFLATTKTTFDLIFIDPARRKADKKVFQWTDASPNLLELQDTLLSWSKKVLIKGSPILDIKLSTAQLRNVRQVIVLAVEGEVKELLILQEKDFTGHIKLRACNIVDNTINEFKYDLEEENQEGIEYGPAMDLLFEPNAAIMKSGGFGQVAKQFNLTKLHKHTHLYTGDHLIDNFPGRVFRVKDRLALDTKLLKIACPDGKANISVRNFPISVAEVRNKTGLKPAGDLYLFACTNQLGKKEVLVCDQLIH